MKRILIIASVLFAISLHVYAENKTPVTQEMVADIAKKHVIFKGYYLPSEVEKMALDISFLNGNWIVFFPPTKTPEGANVTGTGYRMLITEDGEIK